MYESVPNMPLAAKLCRQADAFVVVGTKLAVYPAAGLVDEVPEGVLKFVVDVSAPYVSGGNLVINIEAPATLGVPLMIEQLKDYFFK
jgi:NAD-dependent deacetylase